jgi:hypothetical protein
MLRSHGIGPESASRLCGRPLAPVPGVARSSRYESRSPAQGVLYQVVREHYETFRAQTDGVCDGAGLPRFVQADRLRAKRCGEPRHSLGGGGSSRASCGAGSSPAASPASSARGAGRSTCCRSPARRGRSVPVAAATRRTCSSATGWPFAWKDAYDRRLDAQPLAPPGPLNFDSHRAIERCFAPARSHAQESRAAVDSGLLAPRSPSSGSYTEKARREGGAYHRRD